MAQYVGKDFIVLLEKAKTSHYLCGKLLHIETSSDS